MLDPITLWVTVGMSVICVLFLASGLWNCFCKKSSDASYTENSSMPTRNNSVSFNNRVQIEKDSNFPPSYSEVNDRRLERTVDL